MRIDEKIGGIPFLKYEHLEGPVVHRMPELTCVHQHGQLPQP